MRVLSYLFIKFKRMKRIFVISLLVVLCFGNNLKAQDKPFIFGFKIAPNTSWMKPDTKGYNSDGAKTGFSWGLMVEFHLMENYKINTGMNIITNGGTLKYEEKYNGEDGLLIRKFNLKYFQIPLTLKMKTNNFGKMSFFGKFGFGTNLLLSAKSEDTFVPDINSSQILNDKDDIKDDMRGLRMSLIIGAGMEYDLGGATKLVTGINFDNGIADVLKGQNAKDPLLQHKSINNFLELYIGILF